ncbi:DNA protecting protein DprA [Pseudoxanthomonas sp. GM95]|uniref:DNA-processing protein DprA n=1 Tax=Pseudoxanthomonas sp. GM95 TaxID=1881043 RepID=UPI0008AAD2B5|nr:DNA-processing protein DprA [Pseudoxanthomonas sp. GM95]SEL55725.1 DNA protecting protein DprA [Pseudoxanthomonas sp. GM95]
MDDETDALLLLILAGGATAPRRLLLDTHGSARAALAAGASAWRAAGLDDKRCARLQSPSAAAFARCETWLDGPAHHLLHWQHPDYPALLRQIPSPPLALFVEGDADLLWHAGVAVVGSRVPTTGGRDNARAFAHGLASAGLVVFSGMATGVDAAAHEAALALPDGRTVAVVGTGPDLAYPASHARLRARLVERGAVVSEFPPGTEARAAHFPSRNRLLAGLSLGTVVIEAAERSGALITARQAGEAGREVFAVPGSIHNPMARGCHRLIRDGATLVETPQDIINGIGTLAGELAQALRQRLASAPQRPHPEARVAPAPLDPDYQTLWKALGHDPTGMDDLVARTRLTTAELSSMLLVMELDGRVAVEHGRYSRRS